MEVLRPGGKRSRPGRGRDAARAPRPPEAGRAGDRPANRSFRAEDDDQHVSPTAPSADKPDATSIGFSTYVHDACTRPPYGRVATVSGSTRLGEAGGGRTMGDGIKMGPRATILVVVLLSARAAGLLTPTPSNTGSKDVQVTGFAGTPTGDGIPGNVPPGRIF